jgi:hypothetical protein
MIGGNNLLPYLVGLKDWLAVWFYLKMMDADARGYQDTCRALQGTVIWHYLA